MLTNLLLRPLEKIIIMEYQFKTNINCGGCIASITPHLNANKEVKSWKVDTTNPQKILTIETDTLSDEAVREIVTKAGYKAEKLSQ
jgi:copper chaperone